MKYILILMVSFFSFGLFAEVCKDFSSQAQIASDKLENLIQQSMYNKKLTAKILCEELEAVQLMVEESLDLGLQCYEENSKMAKRILKFDEDYIQEAKFEALCTETLDRYRVARDLHFINSDFKLLF